MAALEEVLSGHDGATWLLLRKSLQMFLGTSCFAKTTLRTSQEVFCRGGYFAKTTLRTSQEVFVEMVILQRPPSRTSQEVFVEVVQDLLGELWGGPPGLLRRVLRKSSRTSQEVFADVAQDHPGGSRDRFAFRFKTEH